METTLDENNARIVVVGSGAPHFIEGFRERAGFDGLVLTCLLYTSDAADE